MAGRVFNACSVAHVAPSRVISNFLLEGFYFEQVLRSPNVVRVRFVDTG